MNRQPVPGVAVQPGPPSTAEALARYYDLDVLDLAYDAELYQELAQRSGGDVLELGVGTGRLGIPLALAGHAVLGVDDDPAMLARARARWRAIRAGSEDDRFDLVEADLRSFRSRRRFGLAFLAVNTFLLAADDDERLAILTTMRRHLVRGGLACIDVITPDERELADYDGRLQLEWHRRDDETGDEVTKVISARHDPDSATITLTQIFEAAAPAGGRVVTRALRSDTLHLVSADHLADLAVRAGFTDVDLRGDHLSIPYGVGSHRVIAVMALL